MKFEDDELIRQQFADWAADALPFHPRSEINHRAWHAWQVATRLERERNQALRQALERQLFERRRCTACGYVDVHAAEVSMQRSHDEQSSGASSLTPER